MKCAGKDADKTDIEARLRSLCPGKCDRDAGKFCIVDFHVTVPTESSLTGSIMVEQIKSVDCVSRRVKFVEKAPGFVLDEVLSILDACLYASH